MTRDLLYKINASVLDKSRDYILLQCGSGLASMAITGFAKLTYRLHRKDFKAPLPADARLPGHCAWLVYIYGQWVVCEAHARTGVHAITLANWLERLDRGTGLGIYADNADRAQLIGYLGDDYAIVDLADIALNGLFGRDDGKNTSCKIKDRFTCSSYVSVCQIGNAAASHYKLNCKEVQPFHLCLYAIEQGKTIMWYTI